MAEQSAIEWCDSTFNPWIGCTAISPACDHCYAEAQMHPDWARSLRDQCASAGVPFLFKQWGEWKPISEMPESEYGALYRSNRIAQPHEDQAALDELYGRTCKVATDGIGYGGARGSESFLVVNSKSGMQMFKVGKRAAGRLLDGVEHNGFPVVAP